jgi:hypothetical protein
MSVADQGIALPTGTAPSPTVHHSAVVRDARLRLSCDRRCFSDRHECLRQVYHGAYPSLGVRPLARTTNIPNHFGYRGVEYHRESSVGLTCRHYPPGEYPVPVLLEASNGGF